MAQPVTYTAAVQSHTPGQQVLFWTTPKTNCHTYIHINIHARILSKWKNRRLNTATNVILCVLSARNLPYPYSKFFHKLMSNLISNYRTLIIQQKAPQKSIKSS